MTEPKPVAVDIDTRPEPHMMSSEDQLTELVFNTREIVEHLRQLRAVLDPILEDPAQLMANMGPMGAVLGAFIRPASKPVQQTRPL